MGIHSSTRVQAYQLRAEGARARLAILRMIAAESQRNANPHTRLQPGDWRGARSYGLHTYAAAFALLSGGRDGSTQVWVTHAGPEFRNEREAHEILGGRHHRGWYTDIDCDETARGIVAGLSHGRFLAGYTWSSNDERVYFPEVFNDEREAARMSDEHARVFAESAREDSERFHAMTDAEAAAEDAEREAGRAIALRHHPRGGMDEARDALEALRKARADLAERTAEYERG